MLPKFYTCTVNYNNATNVISITSPSGKTISFKPNYLQQPNSVLEFFANCQRKYAQVAYTMVNNVTFTAQLTGASMQHFLNMVK